MTTEDLTLGVYHFPNPPADQWTEALQGFEAAGWDACWLPDHLRGEDPLSIWDPELVELARYRESPHAFFDTVSMLGYAAGVTDDVDLGVGVTETFRRHPVVLAQAMQTIHHLSDGRMLFGLGAGSKLMTEPYGIPYTKPASRLEEALQIIRLAWETGPNERFDFDGECWELEAAVFALPPVEATDASPYPDIFLAANGPRTRALTGRYADGWLPQFVPPSLYREDWQTVANAAREADRDPASVTRAYATAAMLAETREAAREMLDSLEVRIRSVSLPPKLFEACGHEHPLGVGQATYEPTRYDRSAALDLAESIPLEVLEEAFLWGTPEDVVGAVEDYRDVGVEHLVIGNMTPLVAPEQLGRSAELFEEVREAVQS